MECCVVEAIQDRKEDQRFIANHQLKVGQKQAAADNHSRLLAEFAGNQNLDGLVAFIEYYLLIRHKQPINERGDDGLYLDVLKLIQDRAQEFYEHMKAGRLSVNQVTTLMMPLAEILARQKLGKTRDAADLEAEANLSLFTGVRESQTLELHTFGGWLSERIRCDVANWLEKEHNATHFTKSWASRELSRPDEDFTSGRCVSADRETLDRHASACPAPDAYAEARDEIEKLAKDDIDLKILRLAAEERTDSEIGTIIGISQSAVSRRRRIMAGRLDERLRIVADDSVDEAIINGRVSGKSDKAIAKSCDISMATLVGRRSGLQRRYDRRQDQLDLLTAL